MAGGGRSVVVTGGTGALGRAVVERFLEAGDSLVVPWIAKEERDRLEASSLEQIGSGRIRLLEADVAEAPGAAEVARAAPHLEALINCAGGFAGGDPVDATGLEVWDHLYRINLRTAAAMSRAVLPALRARGRGSIVNVASRAAIDAPAGLAAYSASKAGVAVLTETLQKELSGTAIRVNAVVPTTIDTPANREAMPEADFASWTPAARIADVIHWLTTEEAAAVRGALIPV